MKRLPDFKKVVTCHDAEGRAIVFSCGPTTHSVPIKAVPGMTFHEIWNSTACPVPLDNSDDPTAQPLKLSPLPQGSVIRVVDFPPDTVQNQVSAEDVAAALAQVGETHSSHHTTGTQHKLMHRTETLDYGIVMEGELWLVLDDGEVHLKRGDIVVQRGTNHAWSNRTDAMARMIFVLLDGRYAENIQKLLQ
ncbi:cupin domain-containing protein [Pseudomonas sp. NPDC090755]|uniref:cupin domain-containing protein n=1 Tax=Pseudomonas sp. NPDC090755 TaxID=3364481 RepID=UPI00383BEA46